MPFLIFVVPYLIGLSPAKFKKRVQSIQRVDAQISEVSVHTEEVGSRRIFVDVGFDCQDGIIRQFSIASTRRGEYYYRLDDGSYAFLWQGDRLVQGDTGVLSYNPEQGKKGFKGFYKDMTVADFQKMSKSKIS